MTLPPTDLALARARAALGAARALLAAGFFPDAVSRAYYAAFSGACALLASLGLEAATHEGVRVLVSQHFVRTGKLSVASGRALSHLASDRNDADYDLAAVFSSESARDAIESAASFLEDVERLLATR